MSNHSELGLSLTSWGWKVVWAWAITVNWDCHLLAEGGKWCEHEQSQQIGIVTYKLRVKRGALVSMSNHSELGLSLTSWGWKVACAWVITVNWDCHLLAEGAKRCGHQLQWIEIVTYLLRVESGVSMSNHSQLRLPLTRWGWKVVWAWAITVNWDCHSQPEGGKWCEHEQSQWIGIATYLLRVESAMSMSNHSELGMSVTSWGWQVVWAWAITVNWDCHILPEGENWCEHEPSQWFGIVTYSLKVNIGVSMSNHSELALSLTRWGWKLVWAWAITVNWGCHLLPEGGKSCEHEHEQWIGIVTYPLRVESGVSMSNHSELGLSLTSWGWNMVSAWAVTVNWDCHLPTESGKWCEHEQSP